MWDGNAHDAISGLIYASLVLAQLVLARRFRRDPRWRPWRPWLLTGAAATGVLLIACAAAVTGPAAAILQRAAVTLPQAAVAPSRPGSCGVPADYVRSDSVGKASRNKGQRRQGAGQSRADFELRRSFARLEANPSPALAAHVWSGGSKPEPAAIPTWPDDSAGDRFFGTRGIADAAGAPAIVGATLPLAREMATIPELWVVAASALVRAVVLDGLTVYHPAVSAAAACGPCGDERTGTRSSPSGAGRWRPPGLRGGHAGPPAPRPGPDAETRARQEGRRYREPRSRSP